MNISLSPDRFFGRFKEVGYKATSSDFLPVESLHDYLVENELEKRNRLLLYLKKGFCVASWRGFMDDPLNNDLTIGGGKSHITDGYWLWTGFVHYFFEKYNLMLPSGFIRHIEACNYTPPSFEREEMGVILAEHQRLINYSR